MSTPLYESITALLAKEAVPYEAIAHEPVFTSEQACRVVGHSEAEGTKSLVLEAGDGSLFVVTIAGDERFDFKLLKGALGQKRLAMCPPDRLGAVLGTEVGGVAPFGYPEGVRLAVSRRICESARVYVNPGRNDVTLHLSGDAFQRAVTVCGASLF